MQRSPDLSSVETLNLALRIYRRLMFRLVLILVLGFAGVIGLIYLDTVLSPPSGVYILGESLSTWGLIVVLALIIAEIWWEGRSIGRVLHDPLLVSAPSVGIMSGLGVIAQRANAIGMEWSGFLGPLRPARTRKR